MKNILRKTGLVLAVALAAMTVAGPGTAQAAVTGNCGSSYVRVGHWPIDDSKYGRVGYVDVYWSSTAKRNCAVMNATGAAYDFAAVKSVGIWPSSDSSKNDNDYGNYRYYAGPVYTPKGYDMTGKCVDIGGQTQVPDGSMAFEDFANKHCG
ncbi:hypothetical protein [Salininema proteolyticum]|uniref:Uncharacterized protein n=1 Tax=Salininema proteolyticum TaxID=1607685 RepID=A0ABV8TZQ2_9ACTN